VIDFLLDLARRSGQHMELQMQQAMQLLESISKATAELACSY